MSRVMGKRPDPSDQSSRSVSPETAGPARKRHQTTSTFGVKHRQFDQLMFGEGVYPEGYDCFNAPTPRNADQIQNILEQRGSPASDIDDIAFKTFKTSIQTIDTTSSFMSLVYPILHGKSGANFFSRSYLQFDELLSFNDKVASLCPVSYDGALPDEIDQRVRADLKQYIVPSDKGVNPVAPNFFMAVLPGDKTSSTTILRRQVIYSGTVGARAMLTVQKYHAADKRCDGNAYTLVAAFQVNTGLLQIFATLPKQSDHGIEYYTTLLDTYGMTTNLTQFRRGLEAFRNAREFCKTQRNHLLAAAAARLQPTADAGMAPRQHSIPSSPPPCGGGPQPGPSGTARNTGQMHPPPRPGPSTLSMQTNRNDVQSQATLQIHRAASSGDAGDSRSRQSASTTSDEQHARATHAHHNAARDPRRTQQRDQPIQLSSDDSSDDDPLAADYSLQSSARVGERARQERPLNQPSSDPRQRPLHSQQSPLGYTTFGYPTEQPQQTVQGQQHPGYSSNAAGTAGSYAAQYQRPPPSSPSAQHRQVPDYRSSRTEPPRNYPQRYQQNPPDQTTSMRPPSQWPASPHVDPTQVRQGPPVHQTPRPPPAGNTASGSRPLRPNTSDSARSRNT